MPDRGRCRCKQAACFAKTVQRVWSAFENALNQGCGTRVPERVPATWIELYEYMVPMMCMVPMMPMGSFATCLRWNMFVVAGAGTSLDKWKRIA